MKIWNWVINLLVMSLPFSWYMIWQMWKELQKKNKIIEFQDSLIKNSKILENEKKQNNNF